MLLLFWLFKYGEFEVRPVEKETRAGASTLPRSNSGSFYDNSKDYEGFDIVYRSESASKPVFDKEAATHGQLQVRWCYCKRCFELR